ncbi:MAG: hypothetical protein NTX14_01860 [Candidatus Nealsonbacteria bacterium]|nr:hypothetical protein [Candidatus Nealsonbacteria bacterium]
MIGKISKIMIIVALLIGASTAMSEQQYREIFPNTSVSELCAAKPVSLDQFVGAMQAIADNEAGRKAFFDPAPNTWDHAVDIQRHFEELAGTKAAGISIGIAYTHGNAEGYVVAPGTSGNFYVCSVASIEAGNATVQVCNATTQNPVFQGMIF